MFTVARFDFDNSGNLSESELAEFQRYGDRVVLNAQQTFQNLAVVSTLLFGATHQSVIGHFKELENKLFPGRSNLPGICY